MSAVTLSSLIDPRCGRSIYLMDNSEIAGTCGSYDGYILAVFLDIVIIVGLLIYYYSTRSPEELAEVKTTFLWKSAWIFGLIGIILITVFIPKLISAFSSRHWEAYNEQIKSYQDMGLSRQQAIEKIQDLYKAEIQARATSSVADAIRSQKNGR